MHQQFVNVHNDVGYAIDDGLIEALETGRGFQWPLGLVTHWNWPMPTKMKAVLGLDFGFNNICQTPTVRSIMLKIVLLERSILLLKPFVE